MEKPNCYNCKYRRNVPGDAHSSCVHPGTAAALDGNPLAAALAIMFDHKPSADEVKEPLKVTAERHGIINGWFHFPVNFDPAWLVTCNGFTSRHEAQQAE